MSLTSPSSQQSSTAKSPSTEVPGLAFETSPSEPTSQMTFGVPVGTGPTGSRKASQLSTNNIKLELGKFYKVEVVIKPMRGGRPPGCRPIRTMQLIDKRSNGVLIMQYQIMTWDRDMRDPKKKPITKNKLVKIKRGQVKGLSDEPVA